ncbi:hypothetical protein AZH46_09695 [Corynebacterium striatum]|nr:hypothetical protein AZH46_09695 [Corynebacterium striatum]
MAQLLGIADGDLGAWGGGEEDAGGGGGIGKPGGLGGAGDLTEGCGAGRVGYDDEQGFGGVDLQVADLDDGRAGLGRGEAWGLGASERAERVK